MDANEVFLENANENDCAKIHEMQVVAFKALLEKYQDFDTNPGAETLERVKQRFAYPQIKHYFIKINSINIGYIRINQIDKKTILLSQIFILPEFQENGFAQQAILLVEKLHPTARMWILDTIKQEQKLRHLYEKMGYIPTGEEKNIKVGMDLIFYTKSKVR